MLILSDGAIGQMMEKVELDEQKPRFTNEEILKNTPWATTGKTTDRERNIITSLDLESIKMERHNKNLQEKYKMVEENEIRFEKIACEDAEYLFVAYGTSARICQKSIEIARAEGIKVWLLRPITLFPFPKKAIRDMASQGKGILCVEMSAGQMIEDVQLSVEGRVKVQHYGRFGGMINSPSDIVEALKKQIIGG